jgi:integrase
MKLTKSTVEGARLPEKGQRFIWDDELRGLGVRLTPTARTYVVQARVNGATRRVTIGRHGVLTVQEARKAAIGELSKMTRGIDPVTEKKKARATSVTLEEVVKQYLKDRGHLKASTRTDIQKHLEGIFADWKDRPVAKITRDMVLRRFRERSETGPAQTNQAFRYLRSWINYAAGTYRDDDDEQLLPHNPVRVLCDAKMWNHVQPRSKRIPLDAIGDAWETIQKSRTAPEQTTVSRALADLTAFLMLTGCRIGEAGPLTWDRLNLDDGSWYLPDPKNRQPITRPLPKVLVEIIKERPRTGDYVFPGRSRGWVTSVRGPLDAIAEATGARISAHDLRRTFRAVAGEVGVEFWKTKLLMGHRLSGDVTLGHYTEKSDLRYLAGDLERIATWITTRKTPTADNVVPFPVRGGAR